MTVTLTAQKTLTGADVGDSLSGGATGYDWGQVQTGNLTPNEFEIYLKHDGGAAIDNLAVNVQEMSGTYGGDYSAAADLTKLIAHGDADRGLELDLDWDSLPSFSSITRFKTGIGVTFATRITVPTTAMSYNDSSTEVAASAPVAGELGEIGNSTLGDRVHVTGRYRAPSAETETGKRQFDLYWSFNFTS